MTITTTKPWGFYGRQQELAQLRAILSRQRWFFVQVAGVIAQPLQSLLALLAVSKNRH